MDNILDAESPPWPPGRAEMAVWSPAEGGRDAGRAYEQLERHDMSLSRRIAGLAVVLVLSLSGLHWLG